MSGKRRSLESILSNKYSLWGNNTNYPMVKWPQYSSMCLAHAFFARKLMENYSSPYDAKDT